MSYVLVAYYSATGSVEKMAKHIARGLHAENVSFRLKPIRPLRESVEEADYLCIDDLEHCQGLILGSPTRFGQAASAVSHFWDQTSELWMQQKLAGLPAAVFTSAASYGCGQSTLLNLMLPLLHHGMMVMGMPASGHKELTTTPYGAFSVEGDLEAAADSGFELGQRVALIVKKLNK